MVKAEQIKEIFALCRQEGITEAEIYYCNKKTTTVQVENHEVDTYQQSDEEGINISGNYAGGFSTTYIEKADSDSICAGIAYLKETAPGNQKPKRNSKLVQLPNQAVPFRQEVPMEEILKQLIHAQKQVEEMDERVWKVTDTGYSKTKVTVKLYGENEVELTDCYEYVQGYVGVIAAEGERKQNAGISKIAAVFEELNYEELGKEAVEKAVGLLKASPIKSGSYPVVLHKDAAAEMFSYMLSAFYQDSVERGYSKFEGKIGTQVGVQALSIFEDPQLPEGGIKRTFDDEGTKTEKKYLIQNGRLEQLLNRSGNHDVTELTGNGYRESYRGNVNTAAINCGIEKGIRTTETILKDLDECVMITDADGLFAGIHANTGDFSVISNGYYMKKGEIIQAVNQITVGGNFYQLFRDIVEISSDVSATGYSVNYFESPSLHIKNLTIGGL